MLEDDFEAEDEAADVTEVSRFEAIQDLEAEAVSAAAAAEVDLDLIRRQNMSLLRIPFDIQVDEWLIKSFFWGSWIVFAIFFVLELAVSRTYTIFQPFQPFGLNQYQQTVKLSSVLIFLLAVYLDAKEIYSAIRQVVPFRKEWAPLVTIDLSEEVKSLFIGSHQIPISDIKEYHTYPKTFIQLSFAGTLVSFIGSSILIFSYRLCYGGVPLGPVLHAS